MPDPIPAGGPPRDPTCGAAPQKTNSGKGLQGIPYVKRSDKPLQGEEKQLSTAAANIAEQLSVPQPGRPFPSSDSKTFAFNCAKETEVSPVLTEEMVWNFLCPSHLNHPAILQRLHLLGLYGSLDAAGRMRGGYKGRHILTDSEIRLMAEDAFNTFCCLPETKIQLSPPTATYVRSGLNAQRISKSGAAELLKKVKREEDGSFSFVSLQEVVLADWRQRVASLLATLRSGSSPVVQRAVGKRRQPWDYSGGRAGSKGRTATAQQQLPRGHLAFFVSNNRRMHKFAAAVSELATMDERQLAANITLIRG